MGIRWKVKEVANQRGILTASQLGEVANLAPNTASSLWHGRPTRIDMPTLSRLCRALHSSVGDLVEYVDAANDDSIVDAIPTREETPATVAA